MLKTFPDGTSHFVSSEGVAMLGETRELNPQVSDQSVKIQNRNFFDTTLAGVLSPSEEIALQCRDLMGTVREAMDKFEESEIYRTPFDETPIEEAPRSRSLNQGNLIHQNKKLFQSKTRAAISSHDNLHRFNDTKDDSPTLEESAEQMVQILRNNSTDANVVHKSLKMLYRNVKAAKEQDTLRSLVKRSNLEVVVLEVMRRNNFLKTTGIQVVCCRILVVLGFDHRIRKRLMDNGAGMLLLRLVKSYYTTEKLMKACIPAINNLLFAEERHEDDAKRMQQTMLESSLTRRLENILRSRQAPEAVKVEVLYLFRTLSVFMHPQIYNESFVTELLVFGYQNAGNEVLSLQLMRTLTAIYNSAPYELQDKFAELGFAELVMKILEVQKDNYALISNMLQLSSSMVLTTTNKMVLKEIEFSSAIIDILRVSKATVLTASEEEQLYVRIVKSSVMVLTELLEGDQILIAGAVQEGITALIKKVGKAAHSGSVNKLCQKLLNIVNKPQNHV